jgi:hypothetical protein
VEKISPYAKFTYESTSAADIGRWVAGHPDPNQMANIISRSYNYVRKLPLKGISEHYFEDDLSLHDAIE